MLATLGRFFMSRQRQDRDQPRGRVGQAEAATVQLRDRLHQRQSKPGARRVPGTLAAEETFGGTRPVRFGNSGALVNHGNLHTGRCQGRRQSHRATRRRELHRIVDQIGDRLLDQFAIAECRQPLGRLHRQRDAVLLGHRPVQLGHIGEQRRHVERGERRPTGAGLDLGDAEQGLEDRDDAVKVGGRPFDGGAQIRGRLGMRRRVLQSGARG